MRLQSHRPNVPGTASITTMTPSTTAFTPTTTKRDTATKHPSNMPTMTTECSNVSLNAAADTVRTHSDAKQKNQSGGAANSNNNTLLQIITNRQYQNYATALTITIGVGCFLLLLNFFIFAGIYRQRESTSKARAKRKKKAEAANARDTDHHLIEGKFLDPMPIRYSEPSTSYVAEHDISLQQFETIAQVTNTKSTSTECSPTHLSLSQHLPADYDNDSDATDDSPSIKISPSIPEPPPPPKNLPPTCYQNLLKPSASQQSLPTAKKRVQIQEISV